MFWSISQKTAEASTALFRLLRKKKAAVECYLSGRWTHELTNVNSGNALDVVGGSTTVGAQIDQYTYNGNAWQQWIFQAP